MNCGNCGNNLEPIHRFCPKCGATVQSQAPPGGSPYNPPPYSAPPQMAGAGALPPKKSSGCGKIALIVLIILVLIGVGIAGAIYYGYRYAEGKLKSSEAYTTAINALKENAEAREQLGEITETGFPIGAYSQDAGGSGKAAFVVSITGTKGKGQYQVELNRSDGVWRVIKGTLRMVNGETIDVVERPLVPDLPTVNRNNDEVPVDPNSKTVSGGVLNGKALKLVQPAYPQIAKSVKASGTVTVQILVDENGNVIRATAVSGHPLLRAAAVAAARASKFSPTKLSGEPVKVSGVITYNFTLE